MNSQQNACNQFEWIIDGQSLQLFQSAKMGEKFCSPKFQTDDDTEWEFECYPNGNGAEGGYVGMAIGAKLQSKQTVIAVNYRYEFIEIDKIANQANVFCYGNTGKTGIWCIFESKLIKNLKQFTIKFTINIQPQPKNASFLWNINGALWKNIQSSESPTHYLIERDVFVSPIFSRNEIIWYLKLYPDGYQGDKKKIVQLLLMYDLNPYFYHQTKCMKLNYNYSDLEGKYKAMPYRYVCCKDLCTFEKLNDLDSLQIDCRIWNELNDQKMDDDNNSLLQLESKKNMELEAKNFSLKNQCNDIKLELNDLTNQYDELRELKNVENKQNEDDMQFENELQKIVKNNDIQKWFEQYINFKQNHYDYIYDKFMEEGFEEFDTIVEIKENDLIEMGVIKKGHRLKLIKHINKVKSIQR